MPKKLNDETIRKIEKLYQQGLNPAQIARATGVSYPTVYGYTLVKERGFASQTEYRDYLAKQRINPET